MSSSFLPTIFSSKYRDSCRIPLWILLLCISVNIHALVVSAQDNDDSQNQADLLTSGDEDQSNDTKTEKVISQRTTADLLAYLQKKGMEDFFNGSDAHTCSSYSSVMDIRGNPKYREIVQKIVEETTVGSFKGKSYEDVANFVDVYDKRFSGSCILERSLSNLDSILEKMGMTNRLSEYMSVPQWTRGVEKVQMLSPQKKDLSFLGMGMSAGTPPEGITAAVIVIGAMEELEELIKLDKIRDKIVVMNVKQANAFKVSHSGTYGQLMQAGAQAILYRSTTSFSLGTPHTRRANLYYGNIKPQIPIGFLSLEDIDLLSRIHSRDESITIKMLMQSSSGTSISRNLFADYVGKEKPEEYVLVGAHTDGWDVGQGAQDDAIGIFMGIQAIQVLQRLNLVPRRTLRVALWTAEELGYIGSRHHIKLNREKFGNMSVMMESDLSCLDSLGFIFYGHSELGCILNEINRLASAVSAVGMVVKSRYVGSDVDNFAAIGIPVISLLGDNGHYFWYHHTAADTVTSLDTKQMDRCLALWTSTAYILADLQEKVKRL